MNEKQLITVSYIGKAIDGDLENRIKNGMKAAGIKFEYAVPDPGSGAMDMIFKCAESVPLSAEESFCIQCFEPVDKAILNERQVCKKCQAEESTPPQGEKATGAPASRAEAHAMKILDTVLNAPVGEVVSIRRSDNKTDSFRKVSQVVNDPEEVAKYSPEAKSREVPPMKVLPPPKAKPKPKTKFNDDGPALTI